MSFLPIFSHEFVFKLVDIDDLFASEDDIEYVLVTLVKLSIYLTGEWALPLTYLVMKSPPLHFQILRSQQTEETPSGIALGMMQSL